MPLQTAPSNPDLPNAPLKRRAFGAFNGVLGKSGFDGAVKWAETTRAAGSESDHRPRDLFLVLIIFTFYSASYSSQMKSRIAGYLAPHSGATLDYSAWFVSVGSVADMALVFSDAGRVRTQTVGAHSNLHSDIAKQGQQQQRNA